MCARWTTLSEEVETVKEVKTPFFFSLAYKYLGKCTVLDDPCQ